MENKQENKAQEENKKEETKSPFEEYLSARKKVEEGETDAIKACEEMGFDFGVDEDFEELPEPPKKVRIRKPASVRDGIEAEKNARLLFEIPPKQEPTIDQILVCKMSRLLKFDDKSLDPLTIMTYGEDFFMMLQARFQRYLL